jgi:hypothetical protein
MSPTLSLDKVSSPSPILYSPVGKSIFVLMLVGFCLGLSFVYFLSMTYVNYMNY